MSRNVIKMQRKATIHGGNNLLSHLLRLCLPGSKLPLHLRGTAVEDALPSAWIDGRWLRLSNTVCLKQSSSL